MKFKVGDKVRVVKTTDNVGNRDHCIGNIYTIRQINPNGDLRGKETHYGVVEDCPFIFYESELVLVGETKIVITTDYKTTVAKLYENGKCVKSAEAKCSPEDTFDFNIGAKLAVERLTEKEETTELRYYNGKVVCVEANTSNTDFTVGRVYCVIDGKFIDNDGEARPVTLDRIRTLNDLKNPYFRNWVYQFIPFVE